MKQNSDLQKVPYEVKPVEIKNKRGSVERVKLKSDFVIMPEETDRFQNALYSLDTIKGYTVWCIPKWGIKFNVRDARTDDLTAITFGVSVINEQKRLSAPFAWSDSYVDIGAIGNNVYSFIDTMRAAYLLLSTIKKDPRESFDLETISSMVYDATYDSTRNNLMNYSGFTAQDVDLGVNKLFSHPDFMDNLSVRPESYVEVFEASQKGLILSSKNIDRIIDKAKFLVTIKDRKFHGKKNYYPESLTSEHVHWYVDNQFIECDTIRNALKKFIIDNDNSKINVRIDKNDSNYERFILTAGSTSLDFMHTYGCADIGISSEERLKEYSGRFFRKETRSICYDLGDKHVIDALYK